MNANILMLLWALLCMILVVIAFLSERVTRRELRREVELLAQQQRMRVLAQQQTNMEALSASERATQLARHVLGPKAFDQLTKNGYLDVPSTRRSAISYRIQHEGPRGIPEVLVMRGRLHAGNICIIPLDHAILPSFDQFITIYLIAKYDEQRLWEVGKYSGSLPAPLQW
jgi:hypothetical protein